MRYKKVSLIVGGGLELTYTENTSSGVETSQKQHNVKNPVVPHPDLVNCFNDMRPILMRIMGIHAMHTFNVIGGYVDATVKQKKAIADMEVVLDEVTDNIMQSIEVRGITISGSEEKPKLLLSGVMNIEGLGKIAINTPNISLSGSRLGIEEALSIIYDTLMEEVEKYIDGKAAQLDMFGGQPEEVEEVEQE